MRLVVTNGDSACERIAASGLGVEVLPWQDMLHEGPVPLTSNSAALTAIRAEFLSSITSGERKPTAELYQRDRVLAAAGIFKEIILFFEHDLFDQLQLLQVLDTLGQRNFKDTKVSMINTDQYISKVETASAIKELFAARVLVEDAHYEQASLVWNAFRSPTPQLLFEFVTGDEPEHLPFLKAAMRRLLQELPDETGLSRSQRQILECLKQDGVQPAKQLYKRAHHDREDPIWLGDWPFALRLVELAGMKKAPLQLHECGESQSETDNGTKVLDVDISEPAPALARALTSAVELTDFGEELLAGDVDCVNANGIDRWLGGTHLQRGNVWRWVESAQALRADKN